MKLLVLLVARLWGLLLPVDDLVVSRDEDDVKAIEGPVWRDVAVVVIDLLEVIPWVQDRVLRGAQSRYRNGNIHQHDRLLRVKDSPEEGKSRKGRYR
jgi:hypothetical protein